MISRPDAREPRSQLAIVGAAATLGAAAGLPWIQSAPNPLALGSRFLVRNANLLSLIRDWPFAALIIVPAVVALIVACRRSPARAGWGLWTAGSLGLLAVWATSESIIAAGQASGTLARVALWGSGLWIALIGYGLIAYAGVLRLRRSPAANSQWLLLLPIVAIAAHAAWLIFYSEPAGNWLLQVFQQEARTGGIQRRIGEHLWLSAISTALSILIGIALGIWGYHRERVARASLYVAGVILTLPSLALFGMLMEPFSALARAFPVLRDYGIGGLGPAPAITGLTLYGLLPVIRNTYTGLKGVSAAQVDAARGMGMTGRQLMFLVLIPHALPVILAGIRQTAVMLTGIAALAQLIGGGGLGYYILMGINRASIAHILLGAVPAVLVAVAVDLALDWLGRRLTPKGLRLSKGVSA
ncbi:MAG: ABC transporter permease [Firmicutes bacterium]|nr:ABC transporter permease [Bacillota bacterium]